MLLAEVGKLREEKRNIQLFVEFIIHTWLSHLQTNLLAKSVLSCVCEASTKLVACSTSIGKAYHFVSFEPLLSSFCLNFCGEFENLKLTNSAARVPISSLFVVTQVFHFFAFAFFGFRELFFMVKRLEKSCGICYIPVPHTNHFTSLNNRSMLIRITRLFLWASC